MTKRIIYENNDGGVSIVIPAIEDMDAVIRKSVPEGTPYEIIEAADIPSDRIFRDAWSKNGTTIDVDMPKARLIHMDRIRKVRDEELDKTDQELLRAIEDGEDIVPIKDRRQKLRDIPQDFDLETAATPEELKELWPPELLNKLVRY